MRKLVGLMLSDSKPSLGIECLSLVTGIGYQGASMEDIARRHRMTRAAVSRRCNEIADMFGLSGIRAMRPSKNRKKCSQSRWESLAKQ